MNTPLHCQLGLCAKGHRGSRRRALWIVLLLGSATSLPAQSAQDLINQMRALRNRDWGHPDNSTPRESRGPTAAQLEAAAARERRAKASALNDEGIAAWNRGAWGIAGEKFRQAYANNPDSQVILTNLANCLHQQGLVATQQGDWEYAAGMLRSAAMHQPKSKEFAQDAETARKKWQEQLALIQAQRDDDKAWKRALAQYEKGRAHVAAGDWAAAEEYFRIAAQMYPKETAYVKNVAFAQSKRGDQAWQNGNENAALDFWIAALETDPTNAYVRKQVPLLQKYMREEREKKAAALFYRQQTEAFSESLAATPVADGLGYEDLSVGKGAFGSNEIKATVKPQSPAAIGTDTRAGDQLLSAGKQAATTGDLAPNYDRGGAANAGTVVFHTSPGRPAPMDLSQFSERAKKDPRIVGALHTLSDLQVKRDELDAQRTQLTKARNQAVNPALMEVMSARVDAIEAAFQTTLTEISVKTEEIEATRRTIDTTVGEPEPAASGADAPSSTPDPTPAPTP